MGSNNNNNNNNNTNNNNNNNTNTNTNESNINDTGGSEDGVGLFAAALSGTNDIKVYSQQSFCSRASLSGHTARITAVHFDKRKRNIVWSSSLDGTIRCWDVDATGDKCIKIVSHNQVGYSSMDINCDGNVLAAGTESVTKEGDKKDQGKEVRCGVDIELWDISDNMVSDPVCLSKFNSIHSDDITYITFHP